MKHQNATMNDANEICAHLCLQGADTYNLKPYNPFNFSFSWMYLKQRNRRPKINCSTFRRACHFEWPRKRRLVTSLCGHSLVVDLTSSHNSKQPCFPQKLFFLLFLLFGFGDFFIFILLMNSSAIFRGSQNHRRKSLTCLYKTCLKWFFFFFSVCKLTSKLGCAWLLRALGPAHLAPILVSTDQRWPRILLEEVVLCLATSSHWSSPFGKAARQRTWKKLL